MRNVLLLRLSKLYGQLEILRLMAALIPFWNKKVFNAIQYNIQVEADSIEDQLKKI